MSVKSLVLEIGELLKDLAEKATSRQLYAAADALMSLDENNTGTDDWLGRRLRQLGKALEVLGR